MKYQNRLYTEAVAQIKNLKKKIAGIDHLHLNLIWNTQILDGFLCSFQTFFSDSMNIHFQTDNRNITALHQTKQRDFTFNTEGNVSDEQKRVTKAERFFHYGSVNWIAVILVMTKITILNRLI